MADLQIGDAVNIDNRGKGRIVNRKDQNFDVKIVGIDYVVTLSPGRITKVPSTVTSDSTWQGDNAGMEILPAKTGRPLSSVFPLLRIPTREHYTVSDTRHHEKSEGMVHGCSVKFSKFQGHRSFGYAVLYNQAQADFMVEPIKTLTVKLQFQEPGLVMSVIGDLNEDISSEWIITAFRNSLSLTLRTTGAWTITNGVDHALNRLVSESHRMRRSDTVPAVGVAYWDKPLLRRSEKKTIGDCDENKSYLENEFRPLPVVKLLLGGELSDLQTIRQAVQNNIPVLVMQGTGGAADVLAESMDEYMEDDDSQTCDNESIEDEDVDTDETKASTVKHFARKIVVSCRNNPDLLRKFELCEMTNPQSLQIAILKSALRGSKLNAKDKISSFLAWDLDLTSLQTLSQALLQDVGIEAQISQKPKILGQMLKNALFTRHFLTQILSILKVSHIQSLYQSKNIMYPDAEKAPWKVSYADITELLKNLYPPLESIGFYFQRSGEHFTSTEEKIVQLFLWSVLSNRDSVSRVLWEEVPEPLLAALVGYKILSQQAKKFQRPQLGLEKHASMFETLAVELLDQYHKSSIQHTRVILSTKSLSWGNLASFRMAIDSQSVMSHESFEPVIKEVWMGDLANSRWKVFWMSLFQMRLCLTYKRAKGIKEKCFNSATAPFVKYFRFMLSYAAFLAAFTINLLLGVEEQVPILSWLVAIWVFAALLEELSQVFRFRGLSLLTTLIFAPYLLFLVGFILRNPHLVIHYEVGTLFLSIALAFFYLSVLRFFLASRAIGIKVVMMREMMWNMVFFMIIMITIMFAYGIVIEVTLFPKADIETHGAKNLLRRPVWQLFGELLLDEVEGTPECQENMTASGEGDCPSVLGRKIAPAMTAIYMFITNVLLLNLLIAVFSSTYRKVESSAVRYLNYESYRLAMEFAVRSYFPPPLSLVENVVTLVRRCLKCDGSSFEDLAQDIHSQALEKGMEFQKTKEDVKWEEAMQDKYLEYSEEKFIQPGSGNLDDNASNTLPKKSSISFSPIRRERVINLDASNDLSSFRRLFLKQMNDLNERLVRIETMLQTKPRELRTDSLSSREVKNMSRGNSSNSQDDTAC